MKDAALTGAVMWHGAAILPRLRAMDWKQVQAVANQAAEHSLEFPLHMAGPKDKFKVPLWSDKELSGAQVIALMVFSLWVLCGEQEEMCSGLVEVWPIKETVFLCKQPNSNPSIPT